MEESSDNKIIIKKLPEIIQEIIILLEKRDFNKLHNIEEQTLETAITNFDKDYSEVCVIIYGLRKLISKEHIYSQKEWKDAQIEITENLNRAIKEFNEEEHSNFNNIIKNIIFIIEKTDKLLGHYVTHIIDDARVRLASIAYAYGLSASQASDLVSANREQLMSFIGVTKMPDEDKKFKSIKERIHLLEIMAKHEKI